MSKAQITDSVKRISSKLSRRGIKGVNDQIRAYIAKVENYQATTEEENLIVEKFLFNDDSGVVEPNQTEATEIEATQPDSTDIESVDNFTHEIETTPETTEIEATEPVLDNNTESSNALTFTNNFEKAAIAKTELSNAGIVVSDTDIINLVVDTSDVYSNRQQFVALMIGKWREKQSLTREEGLDSVRQQLAALKAEEIHGQNQLLEMFQSTSDTIKLYEQQTDQKISDFINSIISRK